MTFSRRRFLTLAATSAAFGGLSQAMAQPAVEYLNEIVGYGDLASDPAGLFDLPEGFSYRVISSFGEPMNDGFVTPSNMDGMAAFSAGGDRVALVRNHEIKPGNLDITAFGPDRKLADRLAANRVYGRYGDGMPMGGGTTTLVWDLREQRLVSQHLSLAGTSTNCAGGPTPRGTWLTCEETVQKKGPTTTHDHGWVFEVSAAERGLADPTPIVGMGRFRHEATATDPRTGIVYLTEDEGDGLFYRYLPNDPDRLLAGGRLQALGFKAGAEADARNWDSAWWRQGDWRETVWIDLDGVDNPTGDLRHRGHAKGAAMFARGEGLFFGKGEIFFTCTSGGAGRHGQIMRYVPSAQEGKPGEADQPGRVQLFVQSDDAARMRMGDNIAVSPWGHLFVCEDKTEGRNMLKAVTPEGQVYTVGRNPAPYPDGENTNTELAGVCFSPDGSTMFLNLYHPGKTLAITGPWARLKV